MADSADTTGMEARLQELITMKNDLKIKLMEALAELTSMKEEVVSLKEGQEAAIVKATEASTKQLEALQGQVRKSSYREMLLGDKIAPDDLDDLQEYLDLQYSKVPESEDKPDFKAWYGETRKTNRVLRAAMKNSVRSAIDDAPETKDKEDVKTNGGANGKGSPAPPAPPKKPAVPVVIKTSDSGPTSPVKPGTPDWEKRKKEYLDMATKKRAVA